MALLSCSRRLHSQPGLRRSRLTDARVHTLQNPSLYSHVTPNPAGYAEQQQQQYQQQQPGYQPGYRQDYVQQQPSTAGGGPLGLDPQEGFAQAGAQQGGASHGSLADYHPASGGAELQDTCRCLLRQLLSGRLQPARIGLHSCMRHLHALRRSGAKETGQRGDRHQHEVGSGQGRRA